MPDPLVSFAEAIEAIRRRVAISDDELVAITAVSSDWSFWAAGLAQLRLVQDVLDSLTSAVKKGLGLAAWKKRLPALLRSAWGKGSAFRLETIFRNAVQHAFGRGRYRQMTHPAVMRFRPYWLFDGVVDSHITVICKERDGIVLPADHPWWLSNYPQLHHRCRSGVRTLRASQAQRRGITTPEQLTDIESEPQTTKNGTFGQAPIGPPGKGTDLSAFDPGLLEVQAAKAAAA